MSGSNGRSSRALEPTDIIVHMQMHSTLDMLYRHAFAIVPINLKSNLHKKTYHFSSSFIADQNYPPCAVCRLSHPRMEFTTAKGNVGEAYLHGRR